MLSKGDAGVGGTSVGGTSVGGTSVGGGSVGDSGTAVAVGWGSGVGVSSPPQAARIPTSKMMVNKVASCFSFMFMPHILSISGRYLLHQHLGDGDKP
jgi:hypothetical protein